MPGIQTLLTPANWHHWSWKNGILAKQPIHQDNFSPRNDYANYFSHNSNSIMTKFQDPSLNCITINFIVAFCVLLGVLHCTPTSSKWCVICSSVAIKTEKHLFIPKCFVPQWVILIHIPVLKKVDFTFLIIPKKIFYWHHFGAVPPPHLFVVRQGAKIVLYRCITMTGTVKGSSLRCCKCRYHLNARFWVWECDLSGRAPVSLQCPAELSKLEKSYSARNPALNPGELECDQIYLFMESVKICSCNIWAKKKPKQNSFIARLWLDLLKPKQTL